jgi:hypothetical protein
MILKSKNMLNRVFKGCPKRNICGLRGSESQTCLCGPYTYCGKYRSIVQIKKETKLFYETQQCQG